MRSDTLRMLEDKPIPLNSNNTITIDGGITYTDNHNKEDSIAAKKRGLIQKNKENYLKNHPDEFIPKKLYLEGYDDRDQNTDKKNFNNQNPAVKIALLIIFGASVLGVFLFDIFFLYLFNEITVAQTGYQLLITAIPFIHQKIWKSSIDFALLYRDELRFVNTQVLMYVNIDKKRE